MAPQGSSRGKGKARAMMPTSVINRRLLLDRDHIQGFILERIRGLVRIFNVCGGTDERSWDLFHDIILLDAVMTRHFSQFQLMWPYRRSRSSPLREWWDALRSYMGQMFDKTRDKMHNWRWVKPHAFGDQVNSYNAQITSSGTVKCTGERFSWYGSDDLRAQIDQPCCRQYKPGDFLAVRRLHWDEIIDKNDDDENWVDPRALNGGRSRPGNGNDNDAGKGEEDMQGGEKGTG